MLDFQIKQEKSSSMYNYDEDFISIFNECYPFERYIVKNPKPINCLFDDAVLTEVFVPYTEIKPILHDGKFIGHTSVNNDEVYVKIKGNAGEMRFSYFDFSDGVRENIRDIIVGDMGEYEYESLYVDHEDEEPDLVEMLMTQNGSLWINMASVMSRNQLEII